MSYLVVFSGKVGIFIWKIVWNYQILDESREGILHFEGVSLEGVQGAVGFREATFCSGGLVREGGGGGGDGGWCRSGG